MPANRFPLAKTTLPQLPPPVTIPEPVTERPFVERLRVLPLEKLMIELPPTLKRELPELPLAEPAMPIAEVLIEIANAFAKLEWPRLEAQAELFLTPMPQLLLLLLYLSVLRLQPPTARPELPCRPSPPPE